MDDTGQISIELLLVISAVVAVAILLINSLKTTSTTGSKELADNVKKASTAVGKIK